ncbi:4'-phosphopantetheinyl transferase family protein [Promicromonospora iranensis]|uniref:4'-phosphopantetheinyl transferase family protein n=1 Tax=Promicromonospora iranensis TaxID=1105144 RepID=UPI0023A962A1|nr:4'-phosphopantetheinyl transferase superfamily protein [Promicromonospora iranensis]
MYFAIRSASTYAVVVSLSYSAVTFVLTRLFHTVWCRSTSSVMPSRHHASCPFAPAGHTVLMRMGPLLPDGISSVEHVGVPRAVPLFPSEESAISNAVPARRDEFAAARGCARAALTDLGIGPVPVDSGPDRAPVWPLGVVGSITHCEGYRAAAVGLSRSWAGIGIDAEVHAPLPPGILPLVATSDEIADASRRVSDVCVDRVLFSAKEAVYKTWSPIMHTWLGFEDVYVILSRKTFIAHVAPSGLGTQALHGRWAVIDGLVLTAVTLEHSKES